MKLLQKKKKYKKTIKKRNDFSLDKKHFTITLQYVIIKIKSFLWKILTF